MLLNLLVTVSLSRSLRDLSMVSGSIADTAASLLSERVLVLSNEQIVK